MRPLTEHACCIWQYMGKYIMDSPHCSYHTIHSQQDGNEKVQHLEITTKRILKTGLVLMTLINIYILVQYPLQRTCLTKSNEPLWSQTIDFETANIKNDTGTPSGCYLVPNHVHFIKFETLHFTFVEMVCVLAALKNQRPDKITFHRNHNLTFTGPYWKLLTTVKAFTDIVDFNYVEEPSEIFGQPIHEHWRKYHGSDITRIRTLMKYGGIFLDGDTYLIRSIDDFRRYEMTLNWDEGQYLGTQLLIAHKDARFLKLWLESYRGEYKKDLWYYNAGERPTKEILWKQPELIHRVKVQFGADTSYIGKIFQKEWADWRKMYALHLLIHHQYLLSNLSSTATFPVAFNEQNIGHYPITFREMVYDVYETGNISWPKEIH